MIFLPFICTVNTLRIWQVYIFGLPRVRYGTELYQEGKQ